jgi:diguanylate cyclase (GGDEF)-like protein/putative nucleotidyltransferase with HDIG domain
MSESPASIRPLTRLGQMYVMTVIVGGLTVLALALHSTLAQPLGHQWFMLAALTLISGSATVTLPSVGASLSVSETFVFASVLLFGPAAGALMVALDGLVISFWMAKRRPEWYRAVFNMAAPSLSIWLAANLFFRGFGIEPLLKNQSLPVKELILPLAVFAVVYFSLNSWLIAFAVAFEKRVSPLDVWRESFMLASVNYLFGASVALLLVAYTRDVDLTFVGVILPLLLVSYLTYRTMMGRVEDANKHVKEVDRLYMSTIETLAMAIDAKDQVTHGHIRRVQAFAVGLARELGVKDCDLIKAIEAASLLHDMGKLAVPEYILNKPGKLTATEFERMKLHASIGADILSAIDFPYPVVPIVRHHHENWNGTGYPDRLKGSDIPIGARILAVVDCFDALTSDRPYRPKLADSDAIQILVERRGTMYDPLIVDTFCRIHSKITPHVLTLNAPTGVLRTIGETHEGTGTHGSAPVLNQIASSSDEMLTLYSLAGALAGQVTVADAGDVITSHLRRLVPASLCVYFLCDPATNEIEAKHVIGEMGDSVRGIRIPLGQRLSGWVAAHRHTITNSDPTLDLGELNRARSAPLKSCISTPLIAEDDQLIGVLTMYSTTANAFNDDHRRVLESVAGQIADTMRRARDFETPRRSQLAGVLDATELQANVSNQFIDTGTPLAMVFVDSEDFHRINVLYGHVVAEEAARHIGWNIQRSLRATDMLFRSGSNDFIALLHSTDPETAYLIARRMERAVAEHPLKCPEREAVLLSVRVGVACCPRDGDSFSSLLAVAQHDAKRPGYDRLDMSVH